MAVNDVTPTRWAGESEPRPVSVVLTWLRDKVRERRRVRARRAAFNHLLTLDQSLLDDIGVTRDEVTWGSYLPIERNAAHEVQERARKRRASEGWITRRTR
ncbi:DUF1127 domain-containing protein [Acuticoccus sp. M5D2P5]|uniref:DUF1127 domain-containing protein n=1 Tax=Acuticoccus kalidii TaxID=2910977 RepID=UPI001F377EFF|nr:DUF1127 domain-containing protein [Acuticoccus kalidii]MCF3932374.1 DUF1127 domain-containing protein [Acuticoccus kalidii]